MSDTKRMEMIAENLIAHFLQRHGILVAKPYFDQEGGDLFAMTNDGGVRYCRIQCKGRTVRPGVNSEVKIRNDQVEASMIVCLFVDDGSLDKLNLYIFFHDDLAKWPKADNDTKYRLGLTHETFHASLSEFRATEAKIERIANQIMSVRLPTTATYRFTASGGVVPGGAAEAEAVPVARALPSHEPPTTSEPTTAE